MVPNNFEDSLKQKLERRSLQPSKDAWEVLEKRLDDTTPEAGSKRYWWIGMAASLVGIAVLITVLNQPETTVQSPTVVDVESNQEIVPVVNEVDATEIQNKKVEEEISTIQAETTDFTLASQELSQSDTMTKENARVTQHNSIVISQSDVKIVTEVEEKPEPMSEEDKKVEQVVKEILALQNSKVAVTEAQIDSMLLAAENELQLQRQDSQNQNKVDAMALLQDVEFELERSFRDKVFEALKSSYKTVKTAVVERNN